MRAVSVHDLQVVIDGGDALVVDVREPWEYAEGRVPGAVLMPLATVPARVGELPRTGRPLLRWAGLGLALVGAGLLLTTSRGAPCGGGERRRAR